MDNISIESIQKNLIHMNLDEYDYLYNVRMPLKSCEICGGNGVAKWDGEDSVLCECLVSTDSSRDKMLFGVLWGLHCLKKSQVYDE